MVTPVLCFCQGNSGWCVVVGAGIPPSYPHLLLQGEEGGYTLLSSFSVWGYAFLLLFLFLKTERCTLCMTENCRLLLIVVSVLLTRELFVLGLMRSLPTGSLRVSL